METVQCLQNDGGVCTIPDRAVVVTRSDVMIRSRDEIAAEFPDFDVTNARLTPLPFEGSHADFLEAVEPQASDGESEGNLLIKEPEVGLRAHLLDTLAESDAAAALVVVCSCGHRFMADV